MFSYTIKSDVTCRETHERTGLAIRHRVWQLEVGSDDFYVSWISASPSGDGPECKAFFCDERGNVDDWEPCAASYSADSNIALSEILDSLLFDEAA